MENADSLEIRNDIKALPMDLEMSLSKEFDTSQTDFNKTKTSHQVSHEMNIKQIPIRQDDGPPDKFFLVLIAAYIFGIASLLPWNFFITANDYWMFKFRNSTTDEMDYKDKDHRTDLQKAFTSYLAIASTGPMVLAHMLNAAFSHRITLKARLGTAFSVSFVMAALTAALTKVDTINHQNVFFGITMLTAVVINAMSALLQGGSVGLAGCLPERYMKGTILGMATGGIFAALAQIASLSDPHPTDSALAYFLCATLLLGLAGLTFSAVLKSDFYRHHMATQIVGKAKEIDKTRDVSLVKIFGKIKFYAISLLLLFTLTLSIFPGVSVLTTSTNPTSSVWTNRLFIPVCNFLLFNLGDLSGRLIGPLPLKKKWCIIPFLLIHSLHVPLLLLCNSQPRHHLPVIFNNDAYFIAFITTLGLTNGYLCNTFFTRGPKCVEKEYQQTAGTMMGLFQGVGLMAGSVISYGLVNLL